VVEPGDTVKFRINNFYPGGEPRTIGYWKNWNTCTGGNQAATAAELGGPDEGWYIVDDLLEDPGYTIGALTLGAGDCEIAVLILDKRKLSGNNKKMASDAAYNMAAQLLAAQLNYSAGAEQCVDATTAIAEGQALLASIGFDGTANYLRPNNAEYGLAIDLGYQLDEYNNGFLCP
jgi:hypothetical protein